VFKFQTKRKRTRGQHLRIRGNKN